MSEKEGKKDFHSRRVHYFYQKRLHIMEDRVIMTMMLKCYWSKSGLTTHSYLLHGEIFNREGGWMSRRETYESRTEALLLPIAEENGVEIYDVEYVKEGSDWYLRAYIDKPGGADINDCERVSRALSDRLDEEDFIEDAYVLEVSSPGLGRTLKKDKHLQRSLGEEVEIRLYKPVEKCREFAGTLKEFDAQSVTIQTAQGERAFDRKDVALIRLALDF